MVQFARFFAVLYGLALFGTIHLGPARFSKFGRYLGPVVGVLATVLWYRCPRCLQCYWAVGASALWSSLLIYLLKTSVLSATLDGPVRNMAANQKAFLSTPACLLREGIRTAHILANNLREDVQVREMVDAFRHVTEQARNVHDVKELLEKVLTNTADWLEKKGFTCAAMLNSSASPVQLCQESLQQAQRDCGQMKGTGPLCNIVRAGEVGCSFISQAMTKSCDFIKNNIASSFKKSQRFLKRTIARHIDSIIEITIFGNQTDHQHHLGHRWLDEVDDTVALPSLSRTLHLAAAFLSWTGLIGFFLETLYFVFKYTRGDLRWRRQKIKRRNRSIEEMWQHFERISWRPQWLQLLADSVLVSIIITGCASCFFLDWLNSTLSGWVSLAVNKLEAADLRIVSIDSDDSSSAGMGQIYRFLKRIVENSRDALSLRSQLGCVPRNLHYYDVYAPFVVLSAALLLATVLQTLLQTYSLHVAGHLYPERRRKRFVNLVYHRTNTRVAEGVPVGGAS